MRHPSKHMRGNAIQALRSEGIRVDVLGEDLQSDVVQVFFFCSHFILFIFSMFSLIICVDFGLFSRNS